MSASIEREIKLRFSSPAEARAAVLALGAEPVHGRRLQEDSLFDTEDERLRAQRSVVRVRSEGPRSLLTFKGPVLPGPVKAREELETVVADGETLRLVLERLGLRVWFRYQKYREEFTHQDVVIAIDETPVGTFIEIEGTEAGILRTSAALGRGTGDYILDSYYALFAKNRERLGFKGTDMVFDDPGRILVNTERRSNAAELAAWPAIVLTAGLGTRLRPLSAARAKPALPVAGMPLAGRILRWLADAGVTSAVLNLHHRPETITAEIGDGSAFGVPVRYSWEPVILGSAGGPARALRLLDAARVLIVNGDTLTDLDVSALVARHLATGAKVTMALIANPDPLHYGGVEVDAGGRVTGFPRPGAGNRGWHYIGIQAVESSVLAPLDPDTRAETVTGIYQDLIAREPGAVRGFISEASFQDIGTAADYLETCLALAGGDASLLRGTRVTIAADARVSDSVLWDDVTIGPGAVIDDCVVADRAVVPAGSRFNRRVLMRADGLDAGPGEERVGALLIAPLDARRRR